MISIDFHSIGNNLRIKIKIIKLTTRNHSQYEKIKKKTHTHVKQLLILVHRVMYGWEPPTNDSVKINFDGSL